MSVWQSLLAKPGSVILPWFGGRKVVRGARTWSIDRMPPHNGWYEFEIDGSRSAILVGPAERDPSFELEHPLVRGYLVGNRLVSDSTRVVMPERFVESTRRVFLADEGLQLIERVVAADAGRGLVFIRTEFPLGPEQAVIEAFEDRKLDLSGIRDVPPALELVFRWMFWQRASSEAAAQRRAEEEARQARIRAEEETRRAAEEARRARIEEASRQVGTGAGRRNLAVHDFRSAARAALSLSGSELLGTRDIDSTRVEVRYRFRHERLACVVDRETLRVLDAGVCLTDERTGEKGDTYFTLESLPAVIGRIMDDDESRLVVWRHG